MKRHTKIVLGLIASGIAVSAVSLGVMASEKFEGHRAEMMTSGGYHGQGRADGHGYMSSRMGQMFEEHDLNDDGFVTQDEVDRVRKEKLSKSDKDKDGTLSLGEFEVHWLEQMRSRMVDHFQRLDDDGSGTITADEFMGPFHNMIERHDLDGDGKIGKKELGEHMGGRGSWHHKRERG